MNLRGLGTIALALVIAGALGFVGGLKASIGNADAEIRSLRAQTEKARVSEDAAKAEAKLYGTVSDGYAQQAVVAGRDIAALKAKLASAQTTLPESAGSVEQHSDPNPGTGGALADLALQSELKDQIISAQDVAIVALEGQVKAQKHQILGLHKALDYADLRADLQAQASKAALDGIKSSRWLGRVEGFAIGAALGYVGGRTR